MSFTYTGDPMSSPLDLVRYSLGDVEPSTPLCTDEECLYALSNAHGNAYLAAADLADTKALAFLRPGAGGTSREAYGQASAFRTLASHLRTLASVHSTAAYAGGISVSDKTQRATNNDTVRPAFTKHLHESRPRTPETEERSEY